MGNFHVLSNNDIISIITYSVFAAIFLVFIFAKLGARDPIPSYKKGIVARIVPWVILLLFLSDAALIVSRLVTYPWDIEPQPSNASAYRELMYLGSGYPVWGWANDYQLAVVGQIGGCIVALCWAAYAFAFKRSNTKWWKKLFKVLAYILLSMLIIGFTFHEWTDTYAIAMFLAPVVLFLVLAHVNPNKKTEPEMNSLVTEDTGEQIITEPETAPRLITKEESDDRFMPKSVEGEMDKAEVDQLSELNIGSISDNVIVDNETVQDAEILIVGERKTSADDSEDRHDIQDQQAIIVGDNIENSSDSVITDEDEEPMKTMFCKYCGNKIELDSTFCKYCGKRLLR